MNRKDSQNGIERTPGLPFAKHTSPRMEIWELPGKTHPDTGTVEDDCGRANRANLRTSEKSKVPGVAMFYVFPGFSGQNAAILSDKLCAGKMSVFTELWFISPQNPSEKIPKIQGHKKQP